MLKRINENAKKLAKLENSKKSKESEIAKLNLDINNIENEMIKIENEMMDLIKGNQKQRTKGPNRRNTSRKSSSQENKNNINEEKVQTKEEEEEEPKKSGFFNS